MTLVATNTRPVWCRIAVRCLCVAALLCGAIAATPGGVRAAGPTLLGATFVGTAATSAGTGIGTDRAGNIYVSGSAGTGIAARAFVTKYDPGGTHVLYTTAVPAPCGAHGNALVVDPAGNAYLTGQYGAKNQYGICQLITDVLAVKLDPAGHILYQKLLGPTARDEVLTEDNNQGEAIAVDPAGNAYITGLADADQLDPHIPITANALQKAGDLHDGFVLKLNPAGNVVYGTFLGGNGTLNEGKGIAVDSAGDAYVTGTTQSSDFPVTANAYQPHLGQRFHITNFLGNAYIVELNPSGTKVLYGSYLGGGEVEIGYAIATDGAGNVYVTGATASPNFPTTSGAYDRTCGTDGNCNVHYVCASGCGDVYQDDVFVVKISLRQSGPAALRYSTFLGGNVDDEGESIAVDRAGIIYVAGRTNSPGGFPTRNGPQVTPGGDADAFVAAINPARAGDASLVFSTFLGGSQGDEALAMSLGKGCLYVTGDAASHNFPVHAALQSTWSGKYGAFLVKLAR
jgi:hypothetical protein